MKPYINSIENIVYNITKNDFRAVHRNDLGMLFVKENDITIKGIMVYIKDDEIKNITTFFNDQTVQSFFKSEYDKYSNYMIDDTCMQHLFDNVIDMKMLNQLPISLVDEEGVEKACELLKQYITQKAIPFFNYWQDIRDFIPFLETDDPIFIQDIFCGDGVEKKVIIWKLCNHPKYQNYVQVLIQSYVDYLEENPNDKWAIKDFKKIKDIVKRLEKTEPLYTWDERYLIKKE
ncbi:hypothetical protein [Maribacter sp. Asnod2-G09]|uniref:hypothetical protein n=1 Tax=Maribacter sp. Asnod2-G09 TaxID=3160577 RepID=UPI00386D1BA1